MTPESWEKDIEKSRSGFKYWLTTYKPCGFEKTTITILVLLFMLEMNTSNTIFRVVHDV